MAFLLQENNKKYIKHVPVYIKSLSIVFLILKDEFLLEIIKGLHWKLKLSFYHVKATFWVDRGPLSPQTTATSTSTAVGIHFKLLLHSKLCILKHSSGCSLHLTHHVSAKISSWVPKNKHIANRQSLLSLLWDFLDYFAHVNCSLWWILSLYLLAISLTLSVINTSTMLFT